METTFQNIAEIVEKKIETSNKDIFISDIFTELGKFSNNRFTDLKGMYVVGKGSWKDHEVGEFLVGNFFPSSSICMGDHKVGKFSLTKNFLT